MQFFSLDVLRCFFLLLLLFSIASSSVYDYNILISSDLTKKKKIHEQKQYFIRVIKIAWCFCFCVCIFFLFYFHVFPFRLLRLSRFTILVSLHSVAEALLSIY